MVIAIAGGTGFIGSYIAESLYKKGYKVLISSRNPKKVSEKFGKFEIFKWNSESDDFPSDVIKASDIVINLVGENISQRWTERVKEKLRSSRINSTRKIVEAFSAVNTSGKVFISASAVGIYGNRGDELLDEGSSFGDDFLAKLCVDWENEAMKAEKYGARVVILRIGIVLGKSGGFLAKLEPLFKLGLGGKISDGKAWISWIHIDDLARIIEFAIENENVKGAYNAVAPEPVTNEDFTKTFAKVLKRPAILPVPKFGLKILFGKELTEVALTASQRVKPTKLIESGFIFQYEDIESALKSLYSK